MPEITPNTIILVSEDVLVQELPDGELVLLSLEDENYFGLDEVGGRCWAELASGARIGDIVERLGGEYDVEPGALTKDIMDLVQNLVDAGLASVEDA